MTDHETAAGVGERHADGMMNEARVAQLEEHRGCRQFEGTPSQAVSEVAGSSPAPANPSPAASTDPAPEGGLREAVEALADEFDNHLTTATCVDDEGWRCASCTTARALRHALAAHPAPETPEQVQARAASTGASEGLSEAECASLSEAVGRSVRPNGYVAVAVERIVAARESAAATRARAEGAAEALRQAADDWARSPDRQRGVGADHWLRDRAARSES